jgi:hypothetical protein
MSKPICVFQSPIFTRSGYGDWAMSVGKSLLKYNKFELFIVPTPWGGTPRKFNLNEIDQTDPLAVELGNKILKAPLQKQPEVFIQMTIPNEFQTPGKFNIGMTAGIETTLPPGEWIEGLNRMNVNFVTSNFTKEIFQKARFTKNFNDGRVEELVLNKPMEVTSWGADTSIYKKTSDKVETIETEMQKIPEKFAFLFVGQWTSFNGLYNDRKDIGNLIKTFYNAFKDKQGELPCLILKTNGINFSITDRTACLARINAIKNEVGGKLPNVYLLHGELTDIEMNALFNHEKVKAHISFTHGEGFGHPLLLASLSGKPVFASNWSGHLDFLNPNYTQLLQGNIKQVDPGAVNQWIIKESSWFNVAYGLAESRIKNMYYSPSKEIRDNAEKLAIENSEKFSLEAMDKILHANLDKYVPQFAVEKKVVIPSLKKSLVKKLELPK